MDRATGRRAQPAPAARPRAAHHAHCAMPRRRLFRSEGRAWAWVAVYTLGLYGTLTLAYDAYTAVYRRIGEAVMSQSINGSFALTGLLVLAFVTFRLPRTARAYGAFAAIAVAVGVCLELIVIPAKRLHFFQYAPLTVLVFDAAGFRVSGRARYAAALAVVSLIGLGDELIQGRLPTRSFGLPDVLTNAAAGLLTLAFLGFVVGADATVNPAPADG